MEKYNKLLLEEKDINELIGYLKARYRGDTKRLQSDIKFKKLSQSDKEYVLDELKAEGENI